MYFGTGGIFDVKIYKVEVMVMLKIKKRLTIRSLN